MTREEFVESYTKIVKRALAFSEESIASGLLALEEMIDEEKYIQRDVFEYGAKLTVDGHDGEIVNKILTNIVELETDKDKKILKTIQKEAVLAILEGHSQRLLLLLLNSYTDITFDEDAILNGENYEY